MVLGYLLTCRNALRLAREAEETARGTVAKLGDQSGTCTYLVRGCDD